MASGRDRFFPILRSLMRAANRDRCKDEAESVILLQSNENVLQTFWTTRRAPDFSQFGGVYSGGVTPDPIPNSEVKPAHGESSTEEARR